MLARLFIGGVLAITLLGADGIIIRGVSVFAPTAAVMRAAQTVWIDGERIRAVGPRVAAPGRAKIIDGRGKYLIPGLIDAHVHLVHVLDFAHVAGDEVLPLYLQAGVTSVRSTGDEIAAEKLVARFAEAHPDTAPRIFLASPLIDGDPPFHRDIGYALTDPAAVPEFVADMKAWGVVTLKLYVGAER